MPRQCAVFRCNNKGKHLFPKSETLRALWVKSLRLDERRKIGWHLRKTSAICSDHFKETDFVTTPALFDGDQGSRRLKKNAVPTNLPWANDKENMNPNASVSVSEDISETNMDILSEECKIQFNPNLVSKDYTRKERFLPVEEIPFLSLDSTDPDIDPLKLSSNDDEYIGETDNEDVIDVENNNTEFKEIGVTKNVLTQTEDDSPTFTLHKYKHNDKAMHFFTGLENFGKFTLAFNILGEYVYNLKYFYGPPPQKLEPFEQFFMTLMILRQHKTFEEISMMYLISVKQITNIFITWVRFMALQWKKIDLWLDKQKVKASIPISCYEKYPNTRVIIDATECPIKKTGLPRAQQITFSTYKNKNTVKFLLGIAPSGLITYVSPCYGGSATDRQIIERSDILQRFNYNDEIMVDKGFNVQDIFLPYGVKVNMPAFFKRGSQINETTLRENRKVASERVHIERVIGLLKTYKILTQPMNRTETLLSSDIVFICAMLVNFRNNIVVK